MKGNLFSKHLRNTYYVPGAMVGARELDKNWAVPAPRSSVQWEDQQLNQLRPSVMNITVEVPACWGLQEHWGELSLPGGAGTIASGRKLCFRSWGMNGVCPAKEGKLGRGNRGIPGREKRLSKVQKERNHSQICTSGSLSVFRNGSPATMPGRW